MSFGGYRKWEIQFPFFRGSSLHHIDQYSLPLLMSLGKIEGYIISTHIRDCDRDTYLPIILSFSLFIIVLAAVFSHRPLLNDRDQLYYAATEGFTLLINKLHLNMFLFIIHY